MEKILKIFYSKEIDSLDVWIDEIERVAIEVREEMASRKERIGKCQKDVKRKKFLGV